MKCKTFCKRKNFLLFSDIVLSNKSDFHKKSIHGTALLAAKESYQISVPRLSRGSTYRQLPVAILLDRVGQVTLVFWPPSRLFQSAQLSQVAFMEGAFKGCRSKEINLTTLTSTVRFKVSAPSTPPPILCYSLLLNQRPSFPASTLQPRPIGLKVDGRANWA